jgi:uroporphyrinogen-III decarboxylase
MGTVLFDTERARHIVEQTVDVFVRLANTLFADGATMLTVSCPLATPAVATREMVVSFTLPALEAAFAQLQGPVILANAGSPMVAHLDLLRGLPATVAFFVDETDDLGQARALLGRDATLMGGLDCSSMARRSAPELEKTCRAILANRRDDARYILSHSGTDVPWSTAPECIDVLRKVAESYKGGASCV